MRGAHENFFGIPMLARVLTLRFNSLTDGLDDAPLREFIKDKEVLAIREHFFKKKILPTAVGRFFSTDLQRPRRLTRNPANGSWRMLQVRPAFPAGACE
jgi:hypothetical protein